MNIMEGARNTVVEKINYNHNLSLIQTLPTSNTISSPQPHTHYPIGDSGRTVHYLDAPTKIFHKREPSENPINMKFTNSSAMKSTHQAHIPQNNYQSK